MWNVLLLRRLCWSGGWGVGGENPLPLQTNICLNACILSETNKIVCRNIQQIDPVDYKEEASAVRLKCIPRSIKASLSTQPKGESMRSLSSEVSEILSDATEISRNITSGTSNNGSKRNTELLMGQKQSRKPESCRNEEENVIKIEES